MPDRIAPATRSAIMRAVKGRDTAPERRVRAALHAAGYRYRVQIRIGLKRPDIIFTKRKIAVLVHGCFWHGHHCAKGRLPGTNVEFWRAKISRNVQRDRETVDALAAQGWRSLVIWECDLKNDPNALDRLMDAIGPTKA